MRPAACRVALKDREEGEALSTETPAEELAEHPPRRHELLSLSVGGLFGVLHGQGQEDPGIPPEGFKPQLSLPQLDAVGAAPALAAQRADDQRGAVVLDKRPFSA